MKGAAGRVPRLRQLVRGVGTYSNKKHGIFWFKPRKLGSVMLVSVTPITLNLYWSLSHKWSWKSSRLRFKRYSYNIMKEREAKLNLLHMRWVLPIYIAKNIQDDSERWDESITKTSLQISAHFLQYYSSLWMIRSAQSELHNSCLYFFKVRLNFIVLCNFFYIFVNECHLKTNWAHCLFRRFKDGRSKNSYHCFLDLVSSDNKNTAEHSR